MMGTFTYYETEIAVDSEDYISAVRFMINDTNVESFDVSDEIITALYNQTSTSASQSTRNIETAIAAQDYICNKRSDNITAWSSAGTSVTYGAKTECQQKLQRLRMKLLEARGIGGVLYPSRTNGFNGW